MKRPLIFRRRPGMWVVIDTNYATYSASTWRRAMDFVCPPGRARVEIHAEMPTVRAFNTAGEQVFPPP